MCDPKILCSDQQGTEDRHSTPRHKRLTESAYLLKGVFPPRWCATISPHFVLNPNEWRRCAFIMDYWGLNLIELKRSPVNHISCHFSLRYGDKSPRWLRLDKTPRWVFPQATVSHRQGGEKRSNED